MEDNTEEALGFWESLKDSVTRPDGYEFNPPLTRDMGFLSRNKDSTPPSVEAASFMAEALPVIGDAIAAKEVWDEINKAEPNWALVGALGGATVVGLIPGVGDAAAKAIKEGAKKGLGVARRIEVDPNAMGSMGGNIRLRPEAPRFNEEALAAASKQNDASREILVAMPIDDFISAAKTGVDDSKLAGTRALVEEGTPFDSVPSLSFKNNGDGTGQVTSHEGRHRALALKEQGDTTIPVVLQAQGGDGPSIRWGKQQDPDDFDYVDNIPTKLIEEGGSSVVPMPESILNLRSNSPDKSGYAQGGVIQQMNKMYKEGGLATDGMDVDPVSGNEIPVGSNAEDVRDNVDAKLSSGEYVVPADVVKYLGVAQLEKLVNKAKVGLEDMEANGRIGGAPVDEPEEVVMTLGSDLDTLDGYASGGMVAGQDIEGIIERVKGAAMQDPSIMNMLKAKGIFVEAVNPSEATPVKMAEGGMLDTTSSFDPFSYTPGFSGAYEATGGMPGKAPSVPGVPDPLAPAAQAPAPTPIQQPEENYDSYSETGTADSTGWMDNFDYTTPQGLFDSTMTTLAVSDKESKKGLGSMAMGLLGSTGIGKAVGFIGKAMALNNVAQARANASILSSQGKVDEAKAVTAAAESYAKAKGVDAFGAISSGDRLANAVKESGKTSAWNSTGSSSGAGSMGSNQSGNNPTLSTSTPGLASSSRPPSRSYEGNDYSQAGSSTPSSKSSAQEAVSESVSKGTVSASTSAGLSGSGMEAGSGVGSNDDGSDYNGPMAKGGLVQKRKAKATSPSKSKMKPTTTTKKGLGRK